MRMTLHVNGLTFESKSEDGVDKEEAKNSVFKLINEMDKLEMECSDGSFVVIGEEAMKRAVLVFSDT